MAGENLIQSVGDKKEYYYVSYCRGKANPCK